MVEFKQPRAFIDFEWVSPKFRHTRQRSLKRDGLVLTPLGCPNMAQQPQMAKEKTKENATNSTLSGRKESGVSCYQLYLQQLSPCSKQADGGGNKRCH